MRAPLIATIVALIGLVTLLALALWQYDRADQKQQLLAQYGRAETPVALAEMPFDKPLPEVALVKAEGHFSPDKRWLLDNRIFKGAVGYEGIGLLNTNEGLLLVNIGWFAAGDSRSELPEFALPAGWLAVEGYLTLPGSNPFIQNTAPEPGWPSRIQQVEIETLSAQLGQELLPAVLHLTGDYGFAGEPLWQPVNMPPEKHLAYAAQWLGLAIAWCVIFYMAIFKPRAKELQ